MSTPISTGPAAISKTEPFDNDVYVIAGVLDPKYSFTWLQDHARNQETQDQLQSSITGMLDFCSYSYTLYFCGFIYVANLLISTV